MTYPRSNLKHAMQGLFTKIRAELRVLPGRIKAHSQEQEGSGSEGPRREDNVAGIVGELWLRQSRKSTKLSSPSKRWDIPLGRKGGSPRLRSLEGESKEGGESLPRLPLACGVASAEVLREQA